MFKRLIFLAVIILMSMPAFAESVDTAWVRTYNYPGNDDDEASAIAVDDSGYVYVTGYSTAAGTNQDYATIKYYPNGDTVWLRRYNGPGNGADWARALIPPLAGRVNSPPLAAFTVQIPSDTPLLAAESFIS